MNGSKLLVFSDDRSTPITIRTRGVIRVLPFPSPRPLPRGEGEPLDRGDETGVIRIFAGRAELFPLPEGEGKGEGEQSELWPGGITTPESPAKARVLLR